MSDNCNCMTVTKCPNNCIACTGIYVNEDLNATILCKCPCHSMDNASQPDTIKNVPGSGKDTTPNRTQVSIRNLEQEDWNYE